MITNQMSLVLWVLLHSLIVVKAFEYRLAEQSKSGILSIADSKFGPLAHVADVCDVDPSI